MIKECTVKDFLDKFNTNDICLEWLKDKFYPDGIFCKKCNKITKHYKTIDRPSYCCEFCGNHVHPTANTIFHKSPTPLKDWFYAIYLMSSTRCGISAKQLERELGVTYKTAWRMFHQIRLMLRQEPIKTSGVFEADETYIGGRHLGKRGRGSENKTIVFGITQRGGKLVAKKIGNIKSSTLIPIIKENVVPNAIIYTDELRSYNKLDKIGFIHEVINHAEKVYAINDCHVNNLEGFWSLLKRGINGVYHSVSRQHLGKYINEYVFRYNNRENTEPMFYLMMSQIQKNSSH
jgi:transposase-like protein